MNTHQIARALELDPITRKTFCGVYASDKLPKEIEHFPCGFVANTDPSNKPGTHWVAFYFLSEHEGQFFDSYGNPPDYYNETFRHYLDHHAVEWNFNTHALQSIWTDVCGQYCLFYLSQRARGHSLSTIVHLFNNNKISNDAKVFKFVNKHFYKSKKMSGENQSSKKLVEN